MPSTTFFNLPAEKREKLLTSARAEFSRVPFSKSSINRIVRGAEIPRGSFYMYFTDKSDLFQYLLGEYGERLSSLMERLLRRENGDPFAAFLDLYDSITADYRGAEGRDHYDYIMQVIRHNGMLQLASFFGGNQRPALERMAAQVDTGLLDLRSEHDLEDMLNILMSASGPAICRGILSEDPAPIRAWYRRVLSILARGMAKAPDPLSPEQAISHS